MINRSLPFVIDKATARRVLWLLLLVALVVVALSPHASWAQAVGDIPTLSDVEAAAKANGDKSFHIFKTLLGPFGENPLSTVGVAETMFGKMFFTFNAVLFVVGCASVAWNVLTQVTVSANAGEVLGRNMSGVWLPVRIGTGTFGLLPVFSGFSLSQAVMMVMAILGIGMANMITTAAVDETAAFKSIIPPPGMSGPEGVHGIDMAVGSTLFKMNVCQLASAEYETIANSGITSAFKTPSIQYDAASHSVITSGSAIKCGSVKMNDAKFREDGALDMMSFRVSSVNYEAIKKMGEAMRDARGTSLSETQTEIQKLAKAWFDSYKKAIDVNGGNVVAGAIAYPDEQIRVVVDNAREKESEALKSAVSSWNKDSENDALTQASKEKMKEGGWMSVGSWYATFAENNSALQTAASASWLQTTPPSPTGDDLENSQYIAGAMAAVNIGKAQANTGTGCPMFVPDALETPTGNCSVGQHIATGLIDIISSGTGGAEMINPIITSKQMGDAILDGLAVFATVSAVPIPGVKTAISKAADVAGSLMKGLSGGEGDGIMGKIMSYVLTALFFLGVFLAVYIPFVPFVSWFAALVSYFASVIEGLAAAQVWAFTHLYGEAGEGMGQSTRQGYIYALNMLLRPGLMVIGFFLASALVTLMGTFLIQQLPAALSNVQGNSMTGPFVLFGVMCTAGIMLFSLIQSSFNLIHEMPDRVISWFGTHAAQGNFARNLDQTVDNKMERASHWGGHGVNTSLTGAGR